MTGKKLTKFGWKWGKPNDDSEKWKSSGDEGW